ncbi:MAG: hypothetical protein IKP75_07835 [Oscillospiraceae bacterium]|nr:hypothetical protein [Oscillospiraceae bacterium]MBR4346826.1 hypothetical protein [Oscillospiraceae bacterium]
MNRGLFGILTAILVLFILLEVSYQAYNAAHDEYTTETAQTFSSADTVSFKGLYVRSEEVIRKNYTGALSYTVGDGGKVASGSVVAYVYNSESDIERNLDIKALEDEVELLKSAQNPGTVLTAQPDFIASLINEEYQSVSSLLAKNDISDLRSHRDNLFRLMCIYQISVGQEENYDERIAALSAQAAQMRTARTGYKDTVTSPDSGYFVSFTDGFESKLRYDRTDELTREQIEEYIDKADDAAARPKSDVGRLIKGYNWKIAGIIDNSANVFNAGDTVKLSFASVSDEVTATIERLDDTEDPEHAVVILRCEEMTYSLVGMRCDNIRMTLHDFEGIRVPREALRFNKNNEKGCYVLWGKRVLFKKVEPIYECDEYLLSKLTSDENYVCVYDNIIIEGVDTAAYMANSDEEIRPNEDDEYPIEYYTNAAQTQGDEQDG